MLTLLRPLFKFLVYSAVLLNFACTHYAEPFTHPAEREKPANESAWRENTYLVLAWHDVEDSDPDQRFLSVSTAHLQQQFSWLKTAGYTPFRWIKSLLPETKASLYPLKPYYSHLMMAMQASMNESTLYCWPISGQPFLPPLVYG